MLQVPPTDWNARSLYLTASQDGGVLLDLDNDEFLALDPVTAQLWSFISAGTPEREAALAVAREYGVDPALVLEDLRNLLSSATARGITPEQVKRCSREGYTAIETKYESFPWYGQQVDARSPVPAFLTIVRAFLGLLLFDFVLSWMGLKAVCRIVNQWPVRKKSPQANIELIGEVCVAVQRACTWYPKRAVCLQRSAVTDCLLKSFGVPATMIIAARVMPMLSHAWVAVNGSVVNDHPQVERVYKPLLVL